MPGITDSEEELKNTGRLIGKLSNLIGVEALPYHTMGVDKYKNLGREYPLEGVADTKPEKAKKAEKMILEGIRESRRNF